MPYNEKQYDAALEFISPSDDNLSSSAWDQRRVAVYDLYEDLYMNAASTLRIVLRGEDQSPMLLPNGKKIIEATSRFLCKNVDYFVEQTGDQAVQEQVDAWFADFFKREAFPTKFNSNKRWGLIRADAYFYVYARPEKVEGKRICVKELDPRQVFEIEDEDGDIIGVHIVELVQDFREPNNADKRIVKRRTFRKQPVGSDDNNGDPTQAITSELTHWELGKWDDRTSDAIEKQVQVPYPEKDEAEEALEAPITQLPVYKWRNNAPQNSSWGTSQLSGLETLLYGLNQSLSDEDAILVFQGLGMYVTNAAPPLDPNTGDVTDWNIGPKQIIELSGDQRFDRVTGITDVSPLQDHMKFMNDMMCEASGTPQTAIGRVDVSIAESGISLQLQLMPLIAANAEKEIEWINVLDQMFYDIATMWLPAYEKEQFGNIEAMTDITVVSIFDDPMPVDKNAKTQEIIQLDQANLILKSMAVAALRELGWRFPTTDANGQPLTDDDIALMLLDQASAVAQAADPFANQGIGGGLDAYGNPINPDQPAPDTPDQQTFDLGTS